MRFGDRNLIFLYFPFHVVRIFFGCKGWIDPFDQNQARKATKFKSEMILSQGSISEGKIVLTSF